MSQKVRNPLAQALGLVFQGLRDKLGGVSSSEIASQLGLAASHYSYKKHLFSPLLIKKYLL